MDKTTASEVKKVLALAITDIDKVRQDYHEFAANVAERFHSPEEEYSKRMKEQRDKRECAVIMLGNIMGNDDLLTRIAAVLSGEYVQDKMI